MSTLYPWFEQPWQALLEQRSRWPHAFLVTCPQGIGGENFAAHFAAYLLCEKMDTTGTGRGIHPKDNQAAPCGTCHSCQLADNHPDYLLVQPETNTGPIKIDQIRALVEFVNQTTHTSQAKVVVLQHAAQMNQASQNAILKTLEEPNPGVFLMLMTATPTRLLPTISSRCQQLVLPIPDESLALRWMQQQPELAECSVPELQGLASQPLQALAWAKSGFLTARSELLTQWLGLRTDRASSPSKLAEAFQQWPVLDGYHCLLTWLGDCIKLMQTKNNAWIGQSEAVLEQMRSSCQGASLASLYDLLSETQQSHSHALRQTNINQQLSFEVLLGQWQVL